MEKKGGLPTEGCRAREGCSLKNGGNSHIHRDDPEDVLLDETSQSPKTHAVDSTYELHHKDSSSERWLDQVPRVRVRDIQDRLTEIRMGCGKPARPVPRILCCTNYHPPLNSALTIMVSFTMRPLLQPSGCWIRLLNLHNG